MNQAAALTAWLIARRQQAERVVQQRLLDHVAAGNTTDFAAAPLSVPASVYSDPLRLDAERRELFMKLPLMAGFSSDLANRGDIKVFDGAGPSIISLATAQARSSRSATARIAVQNWWRARATPASSSARFTPGVLITTDS